MTRRSAVPFVVQGTIWVFSAFKLELSITSIVEKQRLLKDGSFVFTVMFCKFFCYLYLQSLKSSGKRRSVVLAVGLSNGHISRELAEPVGWIELGYT
jgi:hypothetical protein